MSEKVEPSYWEERAKREKERMLKQIQIPEKPSFVTPLKIGLTDIDQYGIYSANDDLIVVDRYCMDETQMDLGDAQRIVACVNAMEGIEDPQKFRDTCEAIRDIEVQAFHEARQTINALRMEDRQIRELINADDNESTYDEVARMKSQLERFKDASLKLLEFVKQDCPPHLRLQIDEVIKEYNS